MCVCVCVCVCVCECVSVCVCVRARAKLVEERAFLNIKYIMLQNISVGPL